MIMVEMIEIIKVASMLLNNTITEKEIINRYNWNNLVKVKIIKEGIALGYINDPTT